MENKNKYTETKSIVKIIIKRHPELATISFQFWHEEPRSNIRNAVDRHLHSILPRMLVHGIECEF